MLQLPRQQVCPKALHLYHLTGVCGKTKQDRRTSAFSLLSPSSSCASWQFMLHFSTGSEQVPETGEQHPQNLLWTCSMLCRVPPQEAKPLHHLPLSCPCTSQFMFQENREKGAAVTTKLVLVEYYGNVSYGQKRSSSPTFYLIQASEFHFAVPGISHGTAGPARLKAGAQKKLRQTESVIFRRCFFPHQNQILKYLTQKDSSSPANGHTIFIKGYSLQEYVIQLYNAAS